VAHSSAEAIVLDVRDLGERDRVAVLLTRERGKLAGVARGARARHSRFAGQLQPLATVRAGWFEKPGRDLVRWSSVELVRPVARFQEDLEGLLLSSYLVDHLLAFAQEDEPSELLYRLTDAVLEALLAGVDRDLAARYFEAWVLRLAGIYPPPEECPHCGRPLVEQAVIPAGGEGLLCVECAGAGSGALPPGATSVGPAVLSFLRRIGRESLRRMAGSPPPAAALTQVEEVNARVRRDFLQGELKSYRVLKRALS
jgi:DNA repair protein RecO (recombination protein O)